MHSTHSGSYEWTEVVRMRESTLASYPLLGLIAGDTLFDSNRLGHVHDVAKRAASSVVADLSLFVRVHDLVDDRSWEDAFELQARPKKIIKSIKLKIFVSFEKLVKKDFFSFFEK